MADKSELRPGRIALGPSSCEISYFGPVSSTLRGKMREITSLQTEPNSRGQGHARALLREICIVADREGLTLLVMPAPYTVGLVEPCMETQPLAHWYAKHFGFFTLQTSPRLLMIRLPGEMQPATRIANLKRTGAPLTPPLATDDNDEG